MWIKAPSFLDRFSDYRVAICESPPDNEKAHFFVASPCLITFPFVTPVSLNVSIVK